MKEREDEKKQRKNLQEVEIKKLQKDSQGEEMTLQQVGDIFNVTRMRICQIEKNSLKKLSSLEGLKSLI